MTITVIARWEDSQMPAPVEWALWRQLRGAFRIQRIIFTPVSPDVDEHLLEQYDTMEEALAAAEGERAFLEPTGYNPMGDLPQGDIVLITGNTTFNNMAFANVNETYKIASPARTVLYPTEAAAIALAIRYGQ